MKIYIAGKITDDPDFMMKFATAEELLRILGYEPVNPTKTDQEQPYKDLILEGIRKLAECEAIYLLSDWMQSPGATAEAHVAKALGLPILTETNIQKRLQEAVNRMASEYAGKEVE